MTTPYARLFAEDTPSRPPDPPEITPCTPAEQAQHRAELLAALHGWQWTDDPRIATRRRARRPVTT